MSKYLVPPEHRLFSNRMIEVANPKQMYMELYTYHTDLRSEIDRRLDEAIQSGNNHRAAELTAFREVNALALVRLHALLIDVDSAHEDFARRFNPLAQMLAGIDSTLGIVEEECEYEGCVD